jgi:hypothetical protein
MALIGTIVYIVTGTFSHGVRRTISLAIGVLIGAQLGRSSLTVFKESGLFEA